MSPFTAVLTVLGDAPAPEDVRARGTVLVIGNFDGVHRGHQAVLREAVAEARGRGLVPAVLTFDPHPAGVLGREAPPLLTTLERRAELIGAFGVERVFVRHFDRAFAACTPEAFARSLLVEALSARVVVVGDNFRFGVKRSGDLASLRELGASLGFEARPHAMAHDSAGAYSSTRAREAIRAGDLDTADLVLGRPHALSGVVVHGAKRGRTIGFPTANLGDVPELLPPDGVYAVDVDELGVGAERSPSGALPLGDGVMNIGVRPTVGGDPRRSIEVHLLRDLGREIYDARLRVHLVARLRAEQRFDGLDALKAQINLDVDNARARLAAWHAREL